MVLKSVPVRLDKDEIFIRNAIQTMSRANRRKTGIRLYAEIQRLKRLNLDYSVRKFWVVKEAAGLRKGDKVYEKHEVIEMKAKGYRFRDILTFGKETRKELKPMVEILDNPLECQHGFTKNKSILTALNDMTNCGLFANSYVFVDLENAFNQITTHQFYLMLRRMFFLNEEDAQWFSKVMSFKGHLFQGNPISPVVFNILSRFISVNIEKMSKGALRVVQYADDIVVVSNQKYVPNGTVGWIIKMVEYAGWKVNPSKVAVRSEKHNWCHLGVRSVNGKLFNKGIRRLKKKVKWLYHVWKYGVRFSNTAMSKVTGLPISLFFFIKGNGAWYKAVRDYLFHARTSDIRFYNLLYQINMDFAREKDPIGFKSLKENILNCLDYNLTHTITMI